MLCTSIEPSKPSPLTYDRVPFAAPFVFVHNVDDPCLKTLSGHVDLRTGDHFTSNGYNYADLECYLIVGEFRWYIDRDARP